MKSLMLIAALALTGCMFSGCSSLTNAGTSSLSITPVMVDNKPQGWALDVKDGKQYASIDVTATKTGDDYSIKLTARGVEAFKGQEIAAGAAQTAASSAVKAAAVGGLVVAAPVLGPMAGAALAAPGLGAAAAGAGALAVGQQLAK
jgi:hypothetical protein